MLQNNPLLAQLKKEIHAQKKREEGTVRYTDKGYGFLDINNKKRFIIPTQYMHNIFNGDRIIATIEEQPNNKAFAKPESLVEAAQTQYIGQIKRQNKQFYFSCVDSFGKNTFAVRVEKHNPAFNTLKDGDWIVANLLQHPFKKPSAIPFAFNYQLTDATDPFAHWAVSLVKNNLPYRAAQTEPESSLNSDMSHYRDLTDALFFTIDGDDTEDMDDAICIVAGETEQNYRIWIAIADPVEVFKEGTALDVEAQQRAMTLYLSGYTVPMLPTSLSSERCSLKPHEKRLSLVCEMVVSAEGNLLLDQTTFFNAWIKSQAKLSYEQVSDWLEHKTSWQPSDNLADSLKLLKKVTDARINWRKTHHLIFPDRPDYSLLVNTQGELDQVVIVPKRIANKLVEEMMVMANISAAHLLQQHQQLALFNTHAGFDAKHLKHVANILAEYDIAVIPEQLSDLDVFRDVMLQVLERNEASLLYRIRRFYAYPEMSFSAAPHYCMGLSSYATWTSPMRKYGDLINQRAIKNIIEHTQADSQAKRYENFLEHVVKVRKASRQAEKEINDRLYFNYLKQQKQSVFHAELIDINRSGAKVRLLENGAIAFLPLQNLHKVREEIKAIPEKGCIELNGGTLYRLGEQLPVSIQQFNERNFSILVKPHHTT